MTRVRQSESFRLRRIASVLALGWVGLAGTACFKPNIQTGGFRCADGGVCPDGFKCDFNLAQPLCVTQLSDGGVGGKGGLGGMGGSGGMGGQTAPSCFDARPDCTPSDDAGICDPFCQTGCGCREKCSVNNAGTLTCNEPTKPVLKGTLAACSVSSRGAPEQADDCAPGHVCLEEECNPRCYRFCRGDQDCDNAPCDRTAGAGGPKVCDVPFTSCTPLGGTKNVGCGIGAMACYLSSSHSDQTVCDCPFNAGTSNDDCSRSRDCNAGLACTYVIGAGKSICLQVCDLMAIPNGSDCLSGTIGSCMPYKGASGTGAPHPRFGVCF
jgi:hypothetical protein